MYALNIALKDVADYIACDKPMKIASELSHNISQFSQKSITACYSISQLLEQAEKLKQAIIRQHRQDAVGVAKCCLT